MRLSFALLISLFTLGAQAQIYYPIPGLVNGSFEGAYLAPDVYSKEQVYFVDGNGDEFLYSQKTTNFKRSGLLSSYAITSAQFGSHSGKFVYNNLTAPTYGGIYINDGVGTKASRSFIYAYNGQSPVGMDEYTNDGVDSELVATYNFINENGRIKAFLLFSDTTSRRDGTLVLTDSITITYHPSGKPLAINEYYKNKVTKLWVPAYRDRYIYTSTGVLSGVIIEEYFQGTYQSDFTFLVDDEVSGDTIRILNVEDEEGMHAGKVVYTRGTASVDEIATIKALELEIFPNPASSQIFVKVPTGFANSTLQVSNITGQIVLTLPVGTKDQISIHTKDLHGTGLFHITLTNPDGSKVTGKVMVP